MNESLLWTDAAQAAASVTTAVALVATGGWAFFRFRSGRSYMPRCHIQLDCDTSESRDLQLRVEAVIVNCGVSLVSFEPTDRARIEVSYVEGQVRDVGAVSWPKATWPMIEDLLAIDGARLNLISLEPAQDIRRTVLFTLPQTWEAACVTCHISHGAGAQSREWIATSVVRRPRTVVQPQIETEPRKADT